MQAIASADAEIQGCARISKAAAQAIAKELGLTQVPSAFQGRIGGAKGMWMVDALDEIWERSSRNFWIEITDSQLKFEKRPIDAYNPDPDQVTFDVNACANQLKSAALNFQLLPILANRGVPEGEIERLLEEDLKSKMDELDAATESTLALRKWNQRSSFMRSDIDREDGDRMQGGLPFSDTEKIDWLIDVRWLTSTSA